MTGARRVVLAAGSAGLVVLGFVAVVALWGDASVALEAFWRGSLGTPSALFSGTLVRAIPLAIVGTGIALAFRAGVFNIGGEGQLLVGAVAATVVALGVPGAGIGALLAALVAGALAGGLWAGIAALLRSRFGVLEVISTIMLNFVAMNLVAFLVRGPLQEPTRVYPQSDLIAAVARLPRLFPGTRLHAGLFIAVLVCVGAWWFLARTAAGFRVRAIGASPAAARVTGGVAVTQVAALTLVASGALAGAAGAIEVLGVTYALYENLSPGYGFSAIAVAILARLNPLGVPLTALLFATLETGALGMQRDAGIPSPFAAVLEAVAILVVIAWSGRHGVLSWRAGRARAAGAAPA